LLEYRPSSLEPVPEVVLVEGKSDFYLLRYCVDVLGLGPDVRLVPGTGAGSLDTPIRLYVGWGKSFLVLLDGDAEGLKQRERYEALFGPVLRDTCVLLPEVCGDSLVLEVEGLLTPSDKPRIVNSILGPDARATKKALHQSVQELFARGEAVELDSETRARLEHLLSALSHRRAADGEQRPLREA